MCDFSIEVGPNNECEFGDSLSLNRIDVIKLTNEPVECYRCGSGAYSQATDDYCKNDRFYIMKDSRDNDVYQCDEASCLGECIRDASDDSLEWHTLTIHIVSGSMID